MSAFRVEREIAGKQIILETGKIAKQADGAIWIQSGGTVVFVTVVSAKTATEGNDFLPLSVEYREKAYAAGKIPGGFFKREGKPYEHEILRARLIDRPLRPMLPKDYCYETQVIASVISYDGINEPDILGVIGTSAAVAVSDIPLTEPFGAVRVAYINGEYVINPPLADKENSSLEIIIAGTGTDIMMVEGGAYEVSEEIMLGALKAAMKPLGEMAELQLELMRLAGKPKRTYKPAALPEGLADAVSSFVGDKAAQVIRIAAKLERNAAMEALVEETVEALVEQFPDHKNLIAAEVDKLLQKAMRDSIVNESMRIDGRRTDEIRPITIEVGILPMVHGSCLFTRGETQSLSVATLGTKLDEQKIEDLDGESFRSFILHYNFPPFSVGEIGKRPGPGRREIGHGHLAERSINPIIPAEERFPYTIRVVSDITESNGSSSMATVCAGALCLMDAGVPIKNPVAGIAMGLIKQDDKFVVLSDIMGQEDHFGDMDFKVAGTKDGITGLQMDIKVPGISFEIMEKALRQAREGRLFILGKMNETLPEPRADLSPNAPRITIIKIRPEKIGEVIGSGGKTIRAIQEETKTVIAIEDDGSVFVSSTDKEGMDKALRIIESIVEEATVGKIYEGPVTRIAAFGAFVKISPTTEGLLHISEISPKRIERVEDVLSVGQQVTVKVIGVEADSGKIRLSIKALTETSPRDESERMRSNDRRGGGGNDRRR